MKALSTGVRAPSTSIVKLTGGLNEQISNIELSSGELFDVENYEEIDGSYAGYRSIQGYERFDGSVETVLDPINDPATMDVMLTSEVPLLWNTDGSLATGGDTVREARRSNITAVPGTGATLAAFWYKGEVYALREDLVNPGYMLLYIATRGTVGGTGGWTAVTGFPVATVPVNDPLVNPVVHCTCQFAKWPSTAPNSESVAITFGGTYSAMVIHRDVAGAHTVHIVDDSAASTPAGEGNLPDSPAVATKVYPGYCKFFNNRLFLAYNNTGSSGSPGADLTTRPRDGGHLFFSNLGQPTFIVTTDYAGEYHFGSPITGLVVSPGEALIVYMERGIKILKKITEVSASTGWIDMIVDEFSDRTNCFNKTAYRFLGTSVFSGDRGIQFIDTSDAFGDFSLSSISKKIQQTYLANTDNILQGFFNREKNQYWLLYDSGLAIILTFDIEKKVKGATLANLKRVITYVDEGRNWNDDYKVIYGDSAGYVHIVSDEACSFDGLEINTRLSTSYHHYNSPANWKIFHKVLFEMSGQRGTQFFVKADFDYRSGDVPKASTDSSVFLSGSGGIWGSSTWGVFRWSGAVTEQPVSYIRGTGTNCSIGVTTFGTHYEPHTIHNFTMTYQRGSQKP